MRVGTFSFFLLSIVTLSSLVNQAETARLPPNPPSPAEHVLQIEWSSFHEFVAPSITPQSCLSCRIQQIISQDEGKKIVAFGTNSSAATLFTWSGDSTSTVNLNIFPAGTATRLTDWSVNMDIAVGGYRWFSTTQLNQNNGSSSQNSSNTRAQTKTEQTKMEFFVAMFPTLESKEPKWVTSVPVNTTQALEKLSPSLVLSRSPGGGIVAITSLGQEMQFVQMDVGGAIKSVGTVNAGKSTLVRRDESKSQTQTQPKTPEQPKPSTQESQEKKIDKDAEMKIMPIGDLEDNVDMDGYNANDNTGTSKTFKTAQDTQSQVDATRIPASLMYNECTNSFLALVYTIPSEEDEQTILEILSIPAKQESQEVKAKIAQSIKIGLIPMTTIKDSNERLGYFVSSGAGSSLKLTRHRRSRLFKKTPAPVESTKTCEVYVSSIVGTGSSLSVKVDSLGRMLMKIDVNNDDRKNIVQVPVGSSISLVTSLPKDDKDEKEEKLLVYGITTDLSELDGTSWTGIKAGPYMTLLSDELSTISITNIPLPKPNEPSSYKSVILPKQLKVQSGKGNSPVAMTGERNLVGVINIAMSDDDNDDDMEAGADDVKVEKVGESETEQTGKQAIETLDDEDFAERTRDLANSSFPADSNPVQGFAPLLILVAGVVIVAYGMRKFNNKRGHQPLNTNDEDETRWRQGEMMEARSPRNNDGFFGLFSSTSGGDRRTSGDYLIVQRDESGHPASSNAQTSPSNQTKKGMDLKNIASRSHQATPDQPAQVLFNASDMEEDEEDWGWK